jgi:hypothetical protein
MDIEIHVLELVSGFLVLELVTVAIKDLGEQDWYDTSGDSKSEGPFLVSNISIDRPRVPNGELGSASNDSLKERDINESDG